MQAISFETNGITSSKHIIIVDNIQYINYTEPSMTHPNGITLISWGNYQVSFDGKGNENIFNDVKEVVGLQTPSENKFKRWIKKLFKL